MQTAQGLVQLNLANLHYCVHQKLKTSNIALPPSEKSFPMFFFGLVSGILSIHWYKFSNSTSSKYSSMSTRVNPFNCRLNVKVSISYWDCTLVDWNKNNCQSINKNQTPNNFSSELPIANSPMKPFNPLQCTWGSKWKSALLSLVTTVLPDWQKRKLKRKVANWICRCCEITIHSFFQTFIMWIHAAVGNPDGNFFFSFY